MCDFQIGQLPVEIGQLTCLQSLFLADNRLTALPKVLVSMKHITRLDIQGNNIDPNDAVLKMKREEREKMATSPPAAHAKSALWEEHEAQMILIRRASQNLSDERMANRKLSLGGDSPRVRGDSPQQVRSVSIAHNPEMEHRDSR